MMREETLRLLRHVAAFDNRRPPDDETRDTWARMLLGATLDDAIAAVDEHFATQPGEYLQVGHVVAGIRRIRAERLRRFGSTELLEAIPADPDDVETWIVQRRALTALVAGGQVTSETSREALEAAVRRATVHELGSAAARRRAIEGADHA